MIYDKVLSYLSPFTSIFPSYYFSSPSLHSSHSGFLVITLQKSALSLCTHSLSPPSPPRHPPMIFPQVSFWIPSLSLSPSSYRRIILASHLQLLYTWHHFLSHFLALSFFIAFITSVHLIYCLTPPHTHTNLHYEMKICVSFIHPTPNPKHLKQFLVCSKCSVIIAERKKERFSSLPQSHSAVSLTRYSQ